MKFRCERDVLIETLNTASRAVSSRGSSLPILSGLRLELIGDTLTVTGSDLDLTIISTANVAGEVNGTAVIQSKLVVDITKSLEPGSVIVSVEQNETKIISGRSEFSLRSIPDEEFPKLTEPKGKEVILQAVEFKDALKQVVTAASSDDSRPILTGVLLAAEKDGLRLVATDSYRLAIRDLPGTSFLEEGQSVLIPRNALIEVTKLVSNEEEIIVCLGERDASFRIGTTRIITRLIEGDFPNYRSLIPTTQPNRLVVGRDVIFDAIKRAKVVAREPSTPIRLHMSESHLEISASSQDLGNTFEQLDSTYTGEELTVAFNPEYLQSGVDASQGDEVILETVDALKPALIKSPENPNFLYLLMPVRVA